MSDELVSDYAASRLITTYGIRVGRDDLALAGWGIAGFIALCEMDCWGAALAWLASYRQPTR